LLLTYLAAKQHITAALPSIALILPSALCTNVIVAGPAVASSHAITLLT
jgi:hypothetical protein